MSHGVSHDDVVRYVDGELDAEAARAVEAAAAADPSIRALIRSLSESAALLRAAFSEPLHDASADDLPARIAAQLAAARAPVATNVITIRPQRRWYIPAAIAASIAIIALGLGGGYFFADARIDAARAQFAAQYIEDQKAFQLALNQALEKQVSGQSVVWHNPNSGNGGAVTPIRTFKSASGEWCREYAYEVAGATGKETLHAVACRAAEGRWQNRVPALVES